MKKVLEQEASSIEEYNIELQEAENEFEKGDYTSHEQLIEEIKKW